MKKILILCTGNSCRSQMADGILKENLPNSFIIKSAGTKPEPVNKYAIKVMSLININISKNESNHINDFDNILFDYVITVCDDALEKYLVLGTLISKFVLYFPEAILSYFKSFS